MTVFKYFLKSALRLKWIIIGYSTIFFALSLINGTNTDSKEISFMETKLSIGIVDMSKSTLSKGLTNYLDKNNSTTEMDYDMDNIKEQIFLQVYDAVIIIPKDFETKVSNKDESIEIFRDDRRMGPLQIENQIHKYLSFANANYENGKYNLEEVSYALNQEVEVELLSINSSLPSTGASAWFRYYYNFTSYIIIAMYVAVIGLIMTDFNDKKIQDRMKVSSKKFLNLNAEMYLGQVVIGLIITTLFVLVSILLKGKIIGQVEFLKHVINIYVFSFSILCLTFLINSLTTSRFVINGISTVASLGTSFISGVLVPQEFLSEKVLTIAKFFPTYYFVRINDMSVSSFSQIRYNLLMQVLFGVVFLSVGLYFSKIRQKA